MAVVGGRHIDPVTNTAGNEPNRPPTLTQIGLSARAKWMIGQSKNSCLDCAQVVPESASISIFGG